MSVRSERGSTSPALMWTALCSSFKADAQLQSWAQGPATAETGDL